MASDAPQRAAGTLRLDAISCRFGSRLILDTVSLDAPSGRVTVLLGPSGCGKTTLLRIAAGIERPSAGRVLIDGEEVAGPSAFVLPEHRRVGLMFQDYALFPHLTVRENVAFGLGALPRAERGAVAARAIEGVGLARLADKRPGQLSGGEQQRVALARALAPSPRILLMDEPFSNLDRGLREDVRSSTLDVLRRAAITTIVVTHDPEEALAIGDHLVLLGEGRVIQAGSAQDLYARPVSLAAARALSEVNAVPGRFSNGGLATPLGTIPAPSAAGAEGADGWLCLRPEVLRLAPAGSGTEGRIVAKTFRGASVLLSVAVKGLPSPLRVAVEGQAPDEGETIRLAVADGAGRIFVQDASRSPAAKD
ncbi:ABC transporter ATP-binding protein [Enterovirga rhinocerotis]|uniref:Iron(III) transport system ATP-binding protein n=1 Tax=Enterovirga rhinocerotis TaxID=1339210 RepID=A0A4R7C4A3_9HYPH|nr:ABC transporter ATP-binding protein [Enterovirga rhinocerotis]TDR93350.1 iron(III) transport system ATP-binding protein [Enterovirga rhinocerotis]